MTDKKILLIDPPFYQLYKDTYSSNIYPLSLGYLAGAVKKYTHWDVMVYNSDFSSRREPFHIEYFRGEGFYSYMKKLGEHTGETWEKIRNVICYYKPSVVGISVKTSTFTSARVIAGIVKDIDKDICVIAGGPHVTVMKEKVLKEDNIDICVVGEGEETLVELLLSLEKKNRLEYVKGIIYRKNGFPVANPPRLMIRELDSLPFPSDYAPQVLYYYESHGVDAFSHIMATRGCPWKCFFCSSGEIWGSNVRFRSVENIVKEILSLREKNINFIHFDDDAFGVKSIYIKELTEEIKRSIPGLNWSCELHVNLVTEEHLKAMKEAGCSRIKLGIESGNNSILKVIRKGFTIEKAMQACELIKKYDITLETFFMTGFPQETEETMKDTMAVIRKIPSDKIIYSIFTPHEGTEAFNYCLEKALIPEDYDPSLYNHQSPLNCFSQHMSRKTFREISLEIEKIVAEKNETHRKRKDAFYSRQLKNEK